MPEDLSVKEKQEEKPIVKLDPDKVNELVQQFADYLVKVSKGYFDRDRKNRGGSIIDKGIQQPVKDPVTSAIFRIRKGYEDGGPPIHPLEELDPEGRLKWWINFLTPPRDDYQDYLRDQLEADLAKLQKTRAK